MSSLQLSGGEGGSSGAVVDQSQGTCDRRVQNAQLSNSGCCTKIGANVRAPFRSPTASEGKAIWAWVCKVWTTFQFSNSASAVLA
jgi:hypothetical protein